MNAKQAKYPQLRFKGFTDPWEERKLGDFGSVGMNRRIYKDQTNERGEIPFFKIGTFGKRPDAFISRKLFNEYKAKYPYPNPGDMLISASGSIGRTIEYKGEDAYYQDSNIVWLQHDQRLDNSFLKQFYAVVRWQGLEGSTIKRLYNKNILGTNITIPSVMEQREIGEFLGKLDVTITLHQRKLAKLKELKQVFLQKMFPKNGSKFPQLRFSGFADAWEQRKLSNLAERVTRKNKNNESGRPLTISAQDGLIDQNDFFDKQIASRDVSGYFLVKNGEFAYNKSYSNGYPWGAIKRLDKYDMGVLSTLYIIFRPTNVSSQFLVSYYDTTRWYKEVAKNAAEGARNHGLLNIAPTDFFSTVLIIPNSIEEQQKIGSFFKQLDDTITLHQRKLEKLQELKKGYLQKMFC